MKPPPSFLIQPLESLSILSHVVSAWARVRLARLARTRASRLAFFLLLLSAATAFAIAPPLGAPTRVRNAFAEAVYWVSLGVLSSVGLGSGLHTFILYLGPHIVRVAAAAAAQGTTAFSARIERYVTLPPHSWDTAGLAAAISPTYAATAWIAERDGGSGSVSFSAVVAKVAWPCFLWGAGTAIGELPPYFIARAARRVGETLAELEEVSTLRGGTKTAAGSSGGPSTGLLGRAKVWVADSIALYGFWAILLAASIPNPLFDVAGLTCGYAGVPFATFFGATVVGKAVVKVCLQAVFIIGLFLHGPALAAALRGSAFGVDVSGAAPSRFSALLDSAELSIARSQHAMLCGGGGVGCRACCETHFRALAPDACHAGCDRSSRSGGGGGGSTFSIVWGWVMLLAIAYFLVSIIDAIVHEHVARTRAEAAAAAAAGAGARSWGRTPAAAATQRGARSGSARGRTRRRA